MRRFLVLLLALCLSAPASAQSSNSARAAAPSSRKGPTPASTVMTVESNRLAKLDPETGMPVIRSATAPPTVRVQMRVLRLVSSSGGAQRMEVLSSPAAVTYSGMRARVEMRSRGRRQAITVLPAVRGDFIVVDCDLQVEETLRGGDGLRMTGGHSHGRKELEPGAATRVTGFTDCENQGVRRAVARGAAPRSRSAYTAYYLEISAGTGKGEHARAADLDSWDR